MYIRDQNKQITRASKFLRTTQNNESFLKIRDNSWPPLSSINSRNQKKCCIRIRRTTSKKTQEGIPTSPSPPSLRQKSPNNCDTDRKIAMLTTAWKKNQWHTSRKQKSGMPSRRYRILHFQEYRLKRLQCSFRRCNSQKNKTRANKYRIKRILITIKRLLLIRCRLRLHPMASTMISRNYLEEITLSLIIKEFCNSF